MKYFISIIFIITFAFNAYATDIVTNNQQYTDCEQTSGSKGGTNSTWNCGEGTITCANMSADCVCTTCALGTTCTKNSDNSFTCQSRELEKKDSIDEKHQKLSE